MKTVEMLVAIQVDVPDDLNTADLRLAIPPDDLRIVNESGFSVEAYVVNYETVAVTQFRPVEDLPVAEP